MSNTVAFAVVEYRSIVASISQAWTVFATMTTETTVTSRTVDGLNCKEPLMQFRCEALYGTCDDLCGVMDVEPLGRYGCILDPSDGPMRFGSVPRASAPSPTASGRTYYRPTVEWAGLARAAPGAAR